VLRREGKRIGFVPTMGALHEGHLSLVRAARQRSDAVVVSIFVNPLQFGPTEDLARYPRDLQGDSTLLKNEGVEIVFVPTAEEMYPAGAATYVTVAGLSERLCGRSRPGHFRGVTTVVSKLFNAIEPNFAFFGQKDAAQHAIIRKMVRDLNFAVAIVVCPIVREPDGLAMSSRNTYLSVEQRRSALALSRTLRKMEEMAKGGDRSVAALIEAGKQEVSREPGVRLDYLEIVDSDTLEPLADVRTGSLVAIAALVGTTRLIDNIVISSR